MQKVAHGPRAMQFVFFLATLSLSILFCQNSCFAKVEPKGITEQELDKFAANNIMFYNPGECMRKVDSTSCFRVDSDTEANDFWYAEGCLNNGRCTTGIYASTAYTSGDTNGFLLNETEVDEELGGLQYIYAENYDIEFDAYQGWIAKFTPNGGNSTRKYYWIVLPAEAYATGFGETYVATFENLDEPIYFITYDTHQCVHQSAQYCEKATADPDGVEIGPEFFGAFSTAGGGGYNEFAAKAGKLKTFCRIKGKGDILAHENGKGSADSSTSNSSNSSKSSNTTNSNNSKDSSQSTSSSSDSKEISGEDITWIGDSYSCGAISIIKETFANISFGGTECDANSYIMSNKGVGDRYGGGGANPPALTILRRVSDAKELKKYLVMAVGTNAGWDDDEVNQLKEIMSANPDTKVILVTAKARAHLMSDDNGTNDRLKALVDSEENYYLADWAAAYDESYFAQNSTHPTANGGYEKWVEIIKEALTRASKSCNSFEGDYPQYFQHKYEESDHENSSTDWTKIQYSGDELAVTGCGPTSMAMLATVATGKDIYPQDVVDITSSTGTYVLMSPTELDPLVGEKYGFEVIPETYSSKDDAYQKIKDYLSKGYMIHLSGEGVHQGFAEYYTPGHYIGLFSMDENEQVWVANSYFSGNSQAPLKEIIDAIHNGVFTAIKGDGSGGDSCFNYCEADDSLTEGGLTEEQAKIFMMNYGENKNNSSYNAIGSSMWNSCNGGGSNCVAFSAFFMSKFTTIGQEGRWGNGNEVVPLLKARSKVDATFGTEPKVYAILSTPEAHTAVVLGHHDGKWIIGHADCYYSGIGRGTGGNGSLDYASRGGGSGFYSIETSDNPSEWTFLEDGYSFAYPDNVYTDKIEEYLKNGV